MPNPEYQYYCEDNQNRESRFTELFVNAFSENIQNALGIDNSSVIIAEFSKTRYGRKGDVDICIAEFADQTASVFKRIIGIEVKASVFDSDYHSLKREKHVEQVEWLLEEGYGEVYLFDVVTTPPEMGWISSKPFEILDSFDKEVLVGGCGHVVIIKTAVQGRTEEESGGMSAPIIKTPAICHPALPLTQDIQNAIMDLMKEVNVIPPVIGAMIIDGKDNGRTPSARVLRAFNQFSSATYSEPTK